MRRLNVVRTSCATAYGVYTQYRAEFLVFMLAGATPLIMMFVWIPLAETGATGEVDATWFAAYFLLVYGTRQMSPIWLIRELDEEVRLGLLSGHLLHPIDPYWRYLGWHLADIMMRVPVVLVFVPLALWLSGAHEAILFDRAPLFALTLGIGILLHFHLEYLFGLLAFWTDQSLALEGLYFTLFSLLGGFFLPLEMLPPTLREAIMLLPWPYIFGFPVEVALGLHQGGELWRSLAIQAGWLVAIAVLGRFMWRRGLRRYGAAGA
jgi:ABC-2 type transport system permease protein